MRSRGIRYVSIHISYISIVSLLPSWDILVPLLIPLIGIHISFSFFGGGVLYSPGKLYPAGRMNYVFSLSWLDKSFHIH